MHCVHITLVILMIILSGHDIVLANIDCEKDSNCNSAQQFELNTEVSGNEIEVTWTFNESISIYGFKPVIYSTDRSVLYESPMLHYSQRYMTISHDLDRENKVCVHVYKNRTHVLTERCEEVKISDHKAIIGILAGIIFIIPCMVGLSYVTYQDYKKRNELPYSKLDTKEVQKKFSPEIVKSSAKADELILKVTLAETKNHNIHGIQNAAFTIDVIEEELKNGKVDNAAKAEEDQDSSLSSALANMENENDTLGDHATENGPEEKNLNTTKTIVESSHL